MNVFSLILLFLTTSLVNFKVCESQNSYIFASENCWKYQNFSERSAHNEMDFNVKGYNFKIAFVQEKSNSSSWVYIEIMNYRNTRFQVLFGASRNPNLSLDHGHFVSGNYNHFSHSKDLIGSFEKIEPECTSFYQVKFSLFPSLRVKWLPPDSTFLGQIYLYFDLDVEDFNKYSFRKNIYFDEKSQITTENEKIKEIEVASEKPESNVVELNNTGDSSSLADAVYILIVAIVCGSQGCILYCMCKSCNYCCKAQNEGSFCSCVSVDDDSNQSENGLHQRSAFTSSAVNRERFNVDNATDHRQQQSEIWSIPITASFKNEIEDLPPSYADLFGKK